MQANVPTSADEKIVQILKIVELRVPNGNVSTTTSIHPCKNSNDVHLGTRASKRKYPEQKVLNWNTRPENLQATLRTYSMLPKSRLPAETPLRASFLPSVFISSTPIQWLLDILPMNSHVYYCLEESWHHLHDSTYRLDSQVSTLALCKLYCNTNSVEYYEPNLEMFDLTLKTCRTEHQSMEGNSLPAILEVVENSRQTSQGRSLHYAPATVGHLLQSRVFMQLENEERLDSNLATTIRADFDLPGQKNVLGQLYIIVPRSDLKAMSPNSDSNALIGGILQPLSKVHLEQLISYYIIRRNVDHSVLFPQSVWDIKKCPQEHSRLRWCILQRPLAYEMECNNTRDKKGLHQSSIMFASLAAAKEAQGGPAAGDDNHCLTSYSAPIGPQVPVTALLIQVR